MCKICIINTWYNSEVCRLVAMLAAKRKKKNQKENWQCNIFTQFRWGNKRHPLSKWIGEVRLGWRREQSREQICLYLKAAPLFVITKLPKHTKKKKKKNLLMLDSFQMCTGPILLWIPVYFKWVIDCQGFFFFFSGIRIPCSLFIGECESFHSFGNTVSIGIWKCLKNSKIRFRTALSTDKGWRIYSRDCVEKESDTDWGKLLYDELIHR